MSTEESYAELVTTDAASAGDADAIRYFRDSINSGEHWYVALLSSMGRWSSACEERDGRTCNYLIDGEAFDWLLLAERLCGAVDCKIPEKERDDLLFYGVPPLEMDSQEVRKLIGGRKYGQYLNYFYGVTVEEGLHLAVQEEIDKERRLRGFRSSPILPKNHLSGFMPLIAILYSKSFVVRRNIPTGKISACLNGRNLSTGSSSTVSSIVRRPGSPAISTNP